jgi:hypothetical protein
MRSKKGVVVFVGEYIRGCLEEGLEGGKVGGDEAGSGGEVWVGEEDVP